MKAAIIAVSALLWMTACNRESKQAARENAAAKDSAAAANREAAKDTNAAGKGMGEKAKEETRQTARDVSEGAATAAGKVKEGANKAGEKVENVFLKDKGLTKEDAKVNERIRAVLKKNKEVSPEAADISLVTQNGEVTLHGTVTSATIRDEAVRLAKNVAGKSKVTSDLKVAERVGTGPDER